MAQFKVSIGLGQRPYTIVAKNFSGTTILSTSNYNSDQLEISDAIMNSLVGGIDMEITDANGKKGFRRYDNVTLSLMKKWHVGACVTNGSPTDHMEGIDKSEANNLTFTTVIFDTDNILTDAQFNALEAAPPYDHTVAPANNDVCRYDQVIHHAWSRTKARHLRIMVWPIRDRKKLGDYTLEGYPGNTFSYTYSQAEMRQDGVTPITRITDPENNTAVVPSHFHPQVMAYVKRLHLIFIKRYKAALEDGTILGWGTAWTKQAENEHSYEYTNNGPSESGESGYEGTQGDFIAESVALFKTTFPAHNSRTVSEIATAGQSTALYTDWTWHLANNGIVKTERETINYVLNNLGTVNRTHA